MNGDRNPDPVRVVVAAMRAGRWEAYAIAAAVAAILALIEFLLFYTGEWIVAAAAVGMVVFTVVMLRPRR